MKRRFGDKCENEGKERGGEEEKEGSNLEYENACDLLKDFPNLKVRGMLPDAETKSEGEYIFETQE